jgi:hypothetical protein
MQTLRLKQARIDEEHYRIELEIEDAQRRRQSAVAKVQVALSDQDREEIRWYMEDFLRYPFDPNPRIAAGVEQRMQDLGRDLFTQLFEATRDTRKLWDKLCDSLSDARVEIAAEAQEAAAIPWELLRPRYLSSPEAYPAQESKYHA